MTMLRPALWTVVLCKSGYLTIVDYGDTFGVYALDYPNEEVRTSFAEALVKMGVSFDNGKQNIGEWKAASTAVA
jgi:hypothetical protein